MGAGYHHPQRWAEVRPCPQGRVRVGETHKRLGEGQARGHSGCAQSFLGQVGNGVTICLWVISGLASGPLTNTTLTDMVFRAGRNFETLK